MSGGDHKRSSTSQEMKRDFRSILDHSMHGGLAYRLDNPNVLHALDSISASRREGRRRAGIADEMTYSESSALPQPKASSTLTQADISLETLGQIEAAKQQEALLLQEAVARRLEEEQLQRLVQRNLLAGSLARADQSAYLSGLSHLSPSLSSLALGNSDLLHLLQQPHVSSVPSQDLGIGRQPSAVGLPTSSSLQSALLNSRSLPSISHIARQAQSQHTLTQEELERLVLFEESRRRNASDRR